MIARPMTPGRSYAVTCNGQSQVVLASNPVDAILIAIALKEAN